MKDRHVLLLWATFGVLMVAGLILSSLGDQARPYEYAGIALLGVLFIVGVIVAVLRFCKSVYQHWLEFQSARHVRKTQIHEQQVQAHTRTTQAYELEERKARWQIEKARIEAEIFTHLSRVPHGTYLIEPDTSLSPYQQEIMYLPSPMLPGRYGAGSSGGPARTGRTAAQADQDELNAALPTHVRYEDVRFQVPEKHVLVGVGREGLETRDRAVGACTWIVGLSVTGKTSTTVIRVEERRCAGHKFLGADPHWFKPDSLLNALRGYEEYFLLPMAQSAEETLAVLRAFLAEFQARKGGQVTKPWQPISLIVDEVGSLMDKATATTQAEKDIIDLLPSIARICGQEARNFAMSGIFISQQATGLAWLRKVSTMVIVHQLLMENEKKLACNYDTAVMDAMKRWPIGRTYIYGIGFGKEGPLTVQQPYMEIEQPVEPDDDDGNGPDDLAWEAEQDELEEMEALQPANADQVLTPVVAEVDNSDLPMDEDVREALEIWDSGGGPREIERALCVTYYRARQLSLLCREYRAVYPVTEVTE
ncbi:MAG: hypothetical protein ACRDHW_01145 [Ktedonobacteraceae bacterium]